MTEYVIDMLASYVLLTTIMLAPLCALFIYPAVYGRIKGLGSIARFSFLCGSLSAGVGVAVLIIYIPIISAFVKLIPSWCASFQESEICLLAGSLKVEVLSKAALVFLAASIFVATIYMPIYVSKYHWLGSKNVSKS